MQVQIEIDKRRFFYELKTKLESLKLLGKSDQPIFFGVNNTDMYKNGSVIESGKMLRILDVDEWKRELSIYCASRITVKAVECFKGEVTQVVFLNEVIPDQPFELRYYALEWEDVPRNPQKKEEEEPMPADPRKNIVPMNLTGYDYADSCIYIYAELKILDATKWKSCCVCGIQRAEMLNCVWNTQLDFCGQTCQSIAWSQKKYNDKTSSGGDQIETSTESVKSLKSKLEMMEL